MTKIPLVTLAKLHATLVTNDNEFWMKEKINKIHLHLLIGYIVLSFVTKMQLFCDNESKCCVATCPIF
jgi:hypothetical protein